LAALSGPHIVHISNILHLPPYVFHSTPSWPIPFPFFLVSTCHLLPGVLPLILQFIFPPSLRPAALRFPCHFPMALCLVIRCHNPLPSIHMAPLISSSTHLLPCVSLSLPVASTCMVISTPYPLVPRVPCHSAHPPLPIMHPSLRTGLHVLSIRPFSRSRWQHEKTSTSQECRVGRAVLNPKEVVIEVVGGG
jgi:hypothetical protein